MLRVLVLTFIVQILAIDALAQSLIKPLNQAEKVVVRGFKGRLQIVPITGESVRVEAQKKEGTLAVWSVVLVDKGNILEVAVRGNSDKEDWEAVRLKKNLPHFDIKVYAPPKKLEVFWAEGQIVVSDFKSDLNIQLSEGDISITDGQGSMGLQMTSGRLKVSDHQGNIDLQTFHGQSHLENIKGSLSVNNHSASYKVLKHKGPIQIVNHSGSVVLDEPVGPIKIKNVSGVMNIKEFDGSLEGEFTRGTLNATAKSVQNFNVNSEEAVIVFEAPKESAAVASLRSEKGHLKGPPYFGKIRKGLWTELRGQLKGKEQGSIKIVSKYGDVVLK